LVHAATIIPKYYVLDIFFCIFRQNRARLSVYYQATHTIGSR
jgi:hypothetical protein